MSAAAGARFQAGGALQSDALYVERAADHEILEALEAGEFCYVLAARQIGKSSLRIRTVRRLRQRHGANIQCASLDLTEIGAVGQTPWAWYRALSELLAEELELPCGIARPQSEETEAPVHAWSRFLHQTIESTPAERRIVIFLDEIELVRLLPFSADDFFASIRAAYNRRADTPSFLRLTFCLFGVATPDELIREESMTPFNVGRAISLHDFSRDEARQLLAGFQDVAGDPEALLDAVLHWTSGHPAMTLHLCASLLTDGGTEPPDARVERLARQEYLNPANPDVTVSYAEKRLFNERPDIIPRAIEIHRRLQEEGAIAFDTGDQAQLALRLAGMAAIRREGDQTLLRIRNAIFEKYYDEEWLQRQEKSRSLYEMVRNWRKNPANPDYLLRGSALHQAIAWSEGRTDLTADESEFLIASTQEEIRVRKRNGALLATLAIGLFLVCAVLGGTITLWWRAHRTATDAEGRRKTAELATWKAQGTLAQSLARLPGSEIDALVAGIQATAPGLADPRQPRPPDEAVSGLADAVAAAHTSLPLKRHTAWVLAAAFSRDGETVVTASTDNTARLWSAKTGEQTALLVGHTQAINTVAYSPSGRQIVTAGDDKTARIWEANGRPLSILAAHTDSVTGATFSPDGAFVVTISADTTACLWSPETGRLLHTLKGHTQPLRAACFSPNTDMLVTAGDDNTIRQWSLPSGQLKSVLYGHTSPILAAAFAPDGRSIATAGADGTARLWSARTGKQTALLVGHTQAINTVAYSPSGRQIVTAGDDKTARIWDPSGKLLHTLKGHSDRVLSAVFSPDGKQIVTASADKTARVWDSSGRRRQLAGHTRSVRTAAFSPDGAEIVTASEDQTARLWNVPSPGVVRMTGHQGGIHHAAYARDSTRLVTAGDDKTARIWDPSGKLLHTLKGHSDRVLSAVFSPDGKQIVTAGADKTARLWQEGRERALLAGHTGIVWSAAFSPDGESVATASQDGTLRLWDAKTGSARRVFNAARSEALTVLAFSSDGTRLVAGGEGSTAYLWNVRTGALIARLKQAAHSIRGLAFSPAGDRIATAGDDGKACLWDGHSGRRLLMLTGHSQSLTSIAFSSDGAHLITASLDGTARTWNSADGSSTAHFQGHEGPIWSAAISPDGTRVITAGDDGTTRLWKAATGGFLALFRSRRGAVWSAAFSPTGARAVTVGADGTAQLLPVTEEDVLDDGILLLSYQPEYRKARELCERYRRSRQ